MDEEVGLIFDNKMLGAQYMEEMGRHFAVEEVEQIIQRQENNKFTGFDGISGDVWKIFCTMKWGIEMLSDILIRLRIGRNFPWTPKLL
jgi:hypothetical protein